MQDDNYYDTYNQDTQGAYAESPYAYAPSQPQSGGILPGNMNHMQMAGLLIASGMPFNKAMVASAAMQQQKQQQAMEQYKMQMAQQQMMQKQQQQQNAMGYIDSLGGGQPQGGAANGMTPNTLAEANAQNTGGNESQLASEVSPDTLKQARLLAQSGDTAGAIKLLNQKTPLQEELAKKDAQALYDAQAVVEQTIPFRHTLDSFEKTLGKVPDALLGPVAGKAAPYLNSDAQVLDSEGKTITTLSRILLKFPASGFSEGDRQFLVDASVGTLKDKKANKDVIKRLRGLMDRSVRYTQALEKKATKTGNLRGAATEFYNQEFGNNSSPQANTPAQASQGQYNEQELQAFAEDAIKRGANPEAIKQRINQMRGS